MTNGFLLDTNICISLLKNCYGIREKVVAVGPRSCYVSEVSIAELYYGASKSSKRIERIKDVAFISSRFEILPIFPALELFGGIKAELEAVRNELKTLKTDLAKLKKVKREVIVEDDDE